MFKPCDIKLAPGKYYAAAVAINADLVGTGDTYATSSYYPSFEVYQRNWAIYYDANGGTGAPATQYQRHYVWLTLSSQIPTRAGYTFLGWSTSANGSVVYQPDGQFGENQSRTLYAKMNLLLTY